MAYTKSNSDSGPESEEEEYEVFANLSHPHLINLAKYLIGCCQVKSRQVKNYEKALWSFERWINFYKNKIVELERDHTNFIDDMFGKPLNKYEILFKEFVIFGFHRTKLALVIYNVGRSRGKGLNYSRKSFDPMSGT